MDWGNLLKQVQFNLLQQAGVNITPAQLGIKPSKSGAFGQVLSQSVGFQNGLQNITLPTAPVAPEDPSDTEAMKVFHQNLLAYNQEYQAYNQKLYSYMVSQLQQMQRQAFSQAQVARLAQNQSRQSSIGSSFSDDTTISSLL